MKKKIKKPQIKGTLLSSSEPFDYKHIKKMRENAANDPELQKIWKQINQQMKLDKAK